ncbi:hypothetical protein [Actinomadura alba]|uniref:Uncharacterized protein n=1 Tax=Actinomadura alba TaxID=406431 RepID=A0ABR7LQ88_9ACTN|nr:hypothetical protein [Actinomadura alba]MBC6466662.1 hypothetical protein [Actinomadura alba]
MAEPTNPELTARRLLKTSEDVNVNIPYELNLLRSRFPSIPLWFGQATRHFWALVDDRLVEAKTPEQLASAITDTRVWPPRGERLDNGPVRRSSPSSATGPYGPGIAEVVRPAATPHARGAVTFAASLDVGRRRQRLGTARSPLDMKPMRRRTGSWMQPVAPNV